MRTHRKRESKRRITYNKVAKNNSKGEQGSLHLYVVSFYHIPDIKEHRRDIILRMK